MLKQTGKETVQLHQSTGLYTAAGPQTQHCLVVIEVYFHAMSSGLGCQSGCLASLTFDHPVFSSLPANDWPFEPLTILIRWHFPDLLHAAQDGQSPSVFHWLLKEPAAVYQATVPLDITMTARLRMHTVREERLPYAA